MGMQAPGAIFDSIFQVAEAAAALVCQTIQRAVAEQAAKSIWIGAFMAGKILAFPVLEKVIVTHTNSP